jgi:hypothetical protein
MWIHHLKVTLRNIIRHKGYAFLNIFGLAAGMACCFHFKAVLASTEKSRLIR